MWKRLLALPATAITAVATMVTPAAAVETTVDVYVDGVCVAGYAPDGGGNDEVTITVTPEGAATVEPYWVVVIDWDNDFAFVSATLTLDVTPAPGYTLGFVGSWVDDGSDCGGDPGPEPEVVLPPGLDRIPPGLEMNGKTPPGWDRGGAIWKLAT